MEVKVKRESDVKFDLKCLMLLMGLLLLVCLVMLHTGLIFRMIQGFESYNSGTNVEQL